MKKKFCMTLVLIFTLALSACGKTDAPAPAVSGDTPSDTPVVSVPTPDGQTGLSLLTACVWNRNHGCIGGVASRNRRGG